MSKIPHKHTNMPLSSPIIMLIVAMGTDDKKSLPDKHFGDSRYFAIYRVDRNGWELLEYRENRSPEEKMHGDPEKARSIIQHLKGCDVLLGHAMGPNFVRIRDESPFVPVISEKKDIEEALSLLRDKLDFISSVIEAKKSGTWDKKVIILK